MKIYLAVINGEKIGYSRKKKIAIRFINGYDASNKGVICNLVKSNDENDSFIKNPDNEIIPVDHIYLPRKYEEAYLIDFREGEIQSIMRDIENLMVNKFMSKKERRYLIDAALSLSAVANEECLYVPSIASLQASSERIMEWRYLCGNY